MKAHCISCRTEAWDDESRFCTQCGYAIRQHCPVCRVPLLVGGEDLVNGKCHGCGVHIRVCSAKLCGRLHAGRDLMCDCTKRPLPLPPRTWATPEGPADLTRAVRIDVKPTISPTKQWNLDDEFRAGIDDGTHITVLTDSAVMRPEVGYQRTLTGHIQDRLFCGGDGTIYLVADGKLLTLGHHKNSNLQQTALFGIQGSTLTATGWMGLSQDGGIFSIGGLQLSKLDIAERVDSLVAGDDSLLITTANAAYCLKGRNLSLLARLQLSKGIHPFFHSDSFWIYVQEEDKGSILKLGELGVESTFEVISYTSLAPVVFSDGSAVLIPTGKGNEIGSVRLRTGHFQSHEGVRNPLDRCYDHCGVETSTDRYLLMVGTILNSDSAIILNVDTGENHFFLIPDEVPKPWISAQWIVQGHRILLAIGAANEGYLLEYPLDA